MANRLSRIYTRTGDEGKTGLADGARIGKDAPRIEAMGAVDETNSAIGLLLCEEMPEQMRACLTGVQHDLFDLGGELSLPGHTIMSGAHVARIERELDALNAHLAPLREFILPGGSRAAALCHIARAQCRRAERALVALHATAALPGPALQYLNRLSDLLFVMARALNRHAGRDDVLWQQGRNRG